MSGRGLLRVSRMPTSSAGAAARQAPRRAPADKYDERRNQLAESALQTLGELGYARTSLREIANNSEFSHGVVHYYFADKLELIIYCVRYYKAHVRDAATTAWSPTSTTAEELLDALRRQAGRDARATRRRCTGSGTTCAPRACSRTTLREAVLDDRPDAGGHDLAGRLPLRRAAAARELAMTPSAAYGVLDGLFQQALLGYLTGDQQQTLDTLTDQVHALMPLTLSS